MGGGRYSNFWFSSSDGADVNKFVSLLSPKNIDRLVEQRGVCIVYTHFASGFVKNGVLDKEFAKAIEYLASQKGWFVPVSQILDYLCDVKGEGGRELTVYRKSKLELKWIIDKGCDFCLCGKVLIESHNIAYRKKDDHNHSHYEK